MSKEDRIASAVTALSATLALLSARTKEAERFYSFIYFGHYTSLELIDVDQLFVIRISTRCRHRSVIVHRRPVSGSIQRDSSRKDFVSEWEHS